MESAGELQLDLCNNVDGVTDGLSHSMPLKWNTLSRQLGLTFTRSMDWKPEIQSIAKAASKESGLPSQGPAFPYS